MSEPRCKKCGEITDSAVCCWPVGGPTPPAAEPDGVKGAAEQWYSDLCDGHPEMKYNARDVDSLEGLLRSVRTTGGMPVDDGEPVTEEWQRVAGATADRGGVVCEPRAKGGDVSDIMTNHERDLLGTLRISDAPTMMFAVGIIDRLTARLAIFERIAAAALDLRTVQRQRARDEAEHCAAGATYGLDVLSQAEKNLDAALAELEAMK